MSRATNTWRGISAGRGSSASRRDSALRDSRGAFCAGAPRRSASCAWTGSAGRAFFPAWPAAPRFAALVEGAVGETASDGRSVREKSFSMRRRKNGRACSLNHVRDQVARVLRMAAAKLDTRRPLAELGVDSLMAFELVNRLEAQVRRGAAVGQAVRGSHDRNFGDRSPCPRRCFAGIHGGGAVLAGRSSRGVGGSGRDVACRER